MMYYVRKLLYFVGFILFFEHSFAQEYTSINASLDELFVIADNQNRDLKILENNRKIAESVIKEEKQNRLPSLESSLALSYNGDGCISDRNFSNGFKAPIPSFGNNFALEAKQIIYAGGAINTAVEMAEVNFNKSKVLSDIARQTIRFVIVGYYLEMIKLKNQRSVIEKNIEQTNKLISQIKAKTNQGIVLKNNITRYELQLQSLNVMLLQVNNTIEIVNSELVNILKLPIGTRIEPKDDYQSILMDNDLKWTQLSKDNSPLLKEALFNIDLVRKSEKIIKSERLPQIFAFASDYLNGPIMIEIPTIDKNFNYWYAGVGIKYNISSLYKNKVKEQKFELSTKNAVEAELKLQEQLDKDISAAQIRYDETKEVYQTRLKSIELANQNYSIVKNRYLNDLALITEMLDAENSKLEAELQASNEQVNILFHYYQLKKLSGTL